MPERKDGTPRSRKNPLNFLMRRVRASKNLDDVTKRHFEWVIAIYQKTDMTTEQELLVSAALHSYGELLRLQVLLEESKPHTTAYRHATWSYAKHLENSKKAFGLARLKGPVGRTTKEASGAKNVKGLWETPTPPTTAGPAKDPIADTA